MKNRIPVFRTNQKLERLDAKNCAVREFTADGVSVGRCMHYVGDADVCPRHGNVAEVQSRYLATGKLTNDNPAEGGREHLGTREEA